MRIRKLAVLIIVFLAVAPAMALAQQSQQETQQGQDPVRVEEELVVRAREWVPENVTTFSKFPFPERLIPASVSSVGKTLIDEQDARTLNEAIYNVAGVSTHRDSSTIESFIMRGFDSLTSGLLLTDGAWEPRTGTSMMYNIDRIEVVRGPLGFLYGGNALAGAVNLVRKRPVAENHLFVDVLGGSFATGYGTVDFNRASADGKYAFRLNGMFSDSDEYRDDSGSRVWAINPAFTAMVGDKTSLTFNFDYDSQRFATDGGIPVVFGEIPDIPPTQSYSYPGNESLLETQRFRVDLESYVSDDIVIRNKFYFSDQAWGTEGSAIVGTVPTFLLLPIPGIPLDLVSVLRLQTFLDQDTRIFGNQFEMLASLETGSVTHDFLAGFELQSFENFGVLEIASLAPIDLDNPVELPIPPFPLPALGLTNDIETTTVAPYILDNMAIGSQFRLTLGGRLDVLDQKNHAVGLDKQYTEFSPFIGGLWAPNDMVSVYANYNQGFSPNIALLTLEDPEPERSQQFEVGIKNEFLDGRVRSSFAFYNLEKENLAIIDGTGITAQLGDQRSRGVELEINGSVGPRTNVLFTYSYTDAELTSFTVFDPIFMEIIDLSGNTPAWVPANVFSSWIRQDLPAGFAVAAGIGYIGDRYLNDKNDFIVDGFVNVDASVYYDRDQFQIVANLKNLTDQTQYSRIFAFDALRPEPGFNMSVGVRMRFN